MGFWLVFLSEKPSSTSRVVGQQIAKTVLKLFIFYNYIIFGGGSEGKGSKNGKRSREGGEGAELILLLRTGRQYIIISPLKLISLSHY